MENETQEENTSTPENESPIAKAERLTASLKEQNEIMKANLDRQERLQANNMLGGHSTAGQAPEKPVEESASDYAKRIESGEK